MATDAFRTSLIEEGVFYLHDLDTGTRVDEFRKKRFPFQTEEGLALCRESLLEHDWVRGTIESFFEYSRLGLLKPFGPRHDTAFCLINNDTSVPTDGANNTRNKAEVLLVHLLSTDSVVTFYKRSHIYSLKAKQGEIGWLEVPQENLNHPNIEMAEINMKEGGFAIMDGRLAFKVIKGVTIIAGFASEEELKHWRKMQYPNESNLIQIVNCMQGERIGMNISFLETPDQSGCM